MKQSYTYILANKKNGTLYLGANSNLVKILDEQRRKIANDPGKQHELRKLVWFELQENQAAAIAREQKIKKWKRKWRVKLIEEKNPTWNDLCNAIIPAQTPIAATAKTAQKSKNRVSKKKLLPKKPTISSRAF
jgi:putative endonuclease